MYKLSIKSDDTRSAEYQQARQYLREIFIEMTFADQCEGYVPPGTGWIVLDCDERALRDCMREIWRDFRYYEEPDALLDMTWVTDWFDGLKDSGSGIQVEMSLKEISTCIQALQNEALAYGRTISQLKGRRAKIHIVEIAEEIKQNCESIRDRLKKYFKPE